MKTATVFLSDLSRALPIAHNLDFIALAGYEGNGGGGGRVRLLKDLTLSIKGRDVLLVEDVVDTGMTLNFLVKTLFGFLVLSNPGARRGAPPAPSGDDSAASQERARLAARKL